LEGHFRREALHELVTSVRTFPMTARVDLQRVLAGYFEQPDLKGRLVGVHVPYSRDTTTIAGLLEETDYPARVGPLQYDEMDVGETMPARCLKTGLWLAGRGKIVFAVVASPMLQYGRQAGIHLEIALLPGEEPAALGRDFFAFVEKEISRAVSYRGKVLSLEAVDNYSGKSSGILVHKLQQVSREEVILPDKTLALLERNVIRFVENRAALGRLNLTIKKGLLFYGPPGTGKTHTIQYLASQIPDHTTLLITAEQVGLLNEYMQLARFLQPCLVVLEDVDLIARSRTTMNSGCQESMLNKLLNEMDGLREDAAVLFVLTTNRPEQLEEALASRPGRVDQAIEFPLPDRMGRKRLVRLYARGVEVSQKLTDWIAAHTEKASASFIKELMRRSAQNAITAGFTTSIRQKDVEDAMEEMLFSGGSLNAKLLGIEQPGRKRK